MNTIHIIKDKSKKNAHKLHIGIFRDFVKAKTTLANIKSQRVLSEQSMLSLETLQVTGYDPNKSSVYFVCDKADAHNGIAGIYQDIQKAYAKVMELQNKVPHHRKRQIQIRCEALT